MRLALINFLKVHPYLLRVFWSIISYSMALLKKIVNIKEKQMLFVSYGGRKFDDSPKAIYDEICRRKEFFDWKLIWAFVEPNQFSISRGRKIKIDTLAFLKALMTSHVWVSNSGMTRGVEYKDDRIIKIETWHGSVLKKGCGDENTHVLGGKREKQSITDFATIRCAQSDIDIDVLSWLFNASKDSFVKAGFPRNDDLANSTSEDCIKAKERLGISPIKKVILYMPTWRQYDLDSSNNIFCKPPINIDYWRNNLGNDYILLIRAHYAVSVALALKDDEFVKNVSNYPKINDLYLASDILISDYSSAIIDYSILERPIFCFAYDYEKYQEKIGLYLDLEKELPEHFYKTEKDLINKISCIDWNYSIDVAKHFKQKHANFANGYASQKVVDRLTSILSLKDEVKS